MPDSFFQRPKMSANGSNRDVITIVSGLPRSGTSMMMRMLEAGGIPVLTDRSREADDSNPKGYYEYELVKRMREGDTRWLKEARGKAVKIISPLLEFLPLDFEYRIVFMQRNMLEILASQKEMLIKRGEANDRVGDHHLAELYQKHLVKVAAWMEQQPNLGVIYFNYNHIIADPRPHVSQLAEFLHPRPIETTKMLSIVETSLYRQRGNRAESPIRT